MAHNNLDALKAIQERIKLCTFHFRMNSPFDMQEIETQHWLLFTHKKNT